MTRAMIGTLAAIIVAATMPASAQQAPRVPLVQDDSPDADVQAGFKEIRARGTAPLNLHRIYANAPKIARASSRLNPTLSRVHRSGLRMTFTSKNDGHSAALCVTSPHSPQPTHDETIVATSSSLSGLGLSLMVSDGQPLKRMHE